MPHKDPEKRRAYCQQYYKLHREELIAYSIKQYKKNPKRAKQSSKEWCKRNPERAREMKRQWAATHLEYNRLQRRKYGAKYPDKIIEINARRRAKIKGAEISKVDFDFIWNRDKGICYLCNQIIDPNDCHFDHVIPLSKGGAHTSDNLRPTHSKCNLQKGDTLIDLKQVAKWVQGKLF